jgi:hypothetical protein
LKGFPPHEPESVQSIRKRRDRSGPRFLRELCTVLDLLRGVGPRRWRSPIYYWILAHKP